MGRGYWLPPSAENLVACDGFYIDAAAIYTTDPYEDWEKFLNTLCVKLSYREKTLQRICAWKACSAGQDGLSCCKIIMWTSSPMMLAVM